ncbi:hypothetical protein FHX91_003282 [Clostridium saccharobutylicum]|nr:hypothetical protein [Clostridium saccharobutylicum]MBA8980628.1 hypothetical protein [Clostridium saccharobutylicum]NSA19404.1 hypothetical protein [Clostridium saccharobutylicum]NSB49460.1 hypothetical protein [Clostridium saccharobutylicum]
MDSTVPNVKNMLSLSGIRAVALLCISVKNPKNTIL